MAATAPPASRIAVIKIKAIFFMPPLIDFSDSACVKMIPHVVRVYAVSAMCSLDREPQDGPAYDTPLSYFPRTFSTWPIFSCTLPAIFSSLPSASNLGFVPSFPAISLSLPFTL